VASDATLLDTSVLLDLATDDPRWAEWSEQQIERAAARGALWINDVVYAELSVRFARIEALDRFITRGGLKREPMPAAALFLAGKAFAAYRARGGSRGGVLPDFFIGAHAAVAGVPLLTRDTARVRGSYPGVTLIAPTA
jgi:predicted nucleic acid-binding protein